MANKFLICLFSLFIIVFSSCKKDKSSYQTNSGEIFHTYYNIKYEYTESLNKEIINELNRFDDSLNPFKPTSVISQINNNENTTPDSLFIKVFLRAQEISEISEGIFDITCSPLINAWGFGFKNKEGITPELLDSLNDFVGYKKIKFENGIISKADPRVEVNTSAIAKGYSVDIICELLESYGIENYMCDIGGEIRAKGINEHGECWRIGIDKPVDEKIPEHRELQTIVRLCDKAIATSGNYRNFYEENGKKYAHTINPKTGYPSTNNILSASVIADDCMTADAFATVFMLTSIEKAKEIATNQNLDVFLIYSDENGNISTTYTNNFEKWFVKTNK